MTWTRINEFEAAAGKEQDLKDFLSELLTYLRASDGCEGAELLVEKDVPAHFVVLERWASKEQHGASLAAFPKEKMQSAMPLIGAPPKGRFFHTL